MYYYIKYYSLLLLLLKPKCLIWYKDCYLYQVVEIYLKNR